MFVALALLGGCANTDPTPTYMQMDYQVRCRGMCNSSTDNTPRTITNLDGEDGYVVSCNRNGTALTASFDCNSADDACGGEYSFKVLTATLGSGGPGNDCLVVVSEGANTYEGRCTANEPSADTPCHVDIEQSDDAIIGSVRCMDIPNVNAPTETRAVSDPGTDNPAMFEILNCQ